MTTPPRGFSRLRVLLRLPGIPFRRRVSPVAALASIGLLVFATPAYGASQENILNGVSCTNTTFCIAVGAFGGGVVDRGSLAEEWNGTSWSMLPTPNPSHGSPSALGGVSCIASNACIAVGGSATTSPLVESWTEAAGASRALLPRVPEPISAAFRALLQSSVWPLAPRKAHPFPRNGMERHGTW